MLKLLLVSDQQKVGIGVGALPDHGPMIQGKGDSMNKRNDGLAAVIADHFGVKDLDSCEDAELVHSITTLVKRIHAAGLGPSSVKGLVNTEGVRQILGLASIESTRVTISRDKAFPAAVITEKLWKADEVRKYSLKREQARLGAPGRPPISSRRLAGEE